MVSLNSITEGIGIGSALIDSLIRDATESACSRIWLTTTNDNLSALRFYQRRGFQLIKVHPDAVALARKKKIIPIIGNNNIPIRDELEMEIVLNTYT